MATELQLKTSNNSVFDEVHMTEAAWDQEKLLEVTPSSHQSNLEWKAFAFFTFLRSVMGFMIPYQQVSHRQNTNAGIFSGIGSIYLAFHDFMYQFHTLLPCSFKTQHIQMLGLAIFWSQFSRSNLQTWKTYCSVCLGSSGPTLHQDIEELLHSNLISFFSFIGKF